MPNSKKKSVQILKKPKKQNNIICSIPGGAHILCHLWKRVDFKQSADTKNNFCLKFEHLKFYFILCMLHR